MIYVPVVVVREFSTVGGTVDSGRSRDPGLLNLMGSESSDWKLKIFSRFSRVHILHLAEEIKLILLYIKRLNI